MWGFMGMICCLIEVDEAKIKELLADPESIRDFLGAGEEEEEEEKEFGGIDLDKAWHGIQFLLTGSAWEGEEPLCYLVKGGEEIGDVRYGPARALRPIQIEAWANALSAISIDDLRERYDPEAMINAKIYPGRWGPATEKGGVSKYLLEGYECLRYFLEQTKNAKKGAIIYFG
jgi:hypothetical protein